ncbi:nitrate reductase molybdenum cofactor assembly chaperone [uncultured Jannaschia sp.]|uniref:nitrate reductase molybdenum cofactor assembly chaperone n=1 Tax=uncultured Jannaschia sp. TaxID=293347 RepID=UPI002633E46E|nr:nitrate reductase molybdenum cofactor assembly chaperone [uncultured Jannaschia sp.]
MRLTLRTLAALTGYPSAELKSHVSELRATLEKEKAFGRPVHNGLDALLDRLERDDLIDAQTAYTDLFDRSRALSLHLFEHVHGDNRERGQAMLDLAEQYMQAGLLLESQELPDYIPVFLEYASCLPPAEARETLAQPAHVLAALEQRLRERGSDYAAVFAAILALSNAHPDHKAVDELQKNAPSDDPARIDDEWEEKEVTFTGAHDMGGPTGIVARLRAKGKAMTAARGTKG